MDRTDEIIEREYFRLCREKNRLMHKAENLPQGYISKKTIKGNVYYYLQHREKGKVLSKYLSLEVVDKVTDDINQRKHLIEYVKQINLKLQKLEKIVNVSADDKRCQALYTIEEIKDALQPEFEKNNVKRALLFGSYAKGEAHEGSDVDIMVESDLKGLQFFGLLEDVTNALVIPVDLIEKREVVRHSPLEEEIIKTGLLIYG